ncbi:hypothetical protein ES703_53666 [subsurface metagenome]|nr:glycosyltransferase [Dehalococcoidia bacterium]
MQGIMMLSLSSTRTPTNLIRSEARNHWLSDRNIYPRVSVVVPMYNEVNHIEACLRSILSQNYPADKLEIQVVDGDSTDGSVQLVQERFIEAGAPVLLNRNLERKTSLSLNIGLKASTGQVIIILGAHAEMQPNFIALNVDNLRKENVYCCGGTLLNVGETPVQISIGAAMSHPFAMATAPHRYSQKPGYVKTAVFGAYRQEVFEEIGFFEEEGVISEDAELNWRIIQAGHKIFYDPRIKSLYHPRRTYRSLIRQMFTYGRLRVQMFRKHFEGLSLLHFVPPIFVLLLLVMAIGAVFSNWARFLLAGVVLVYTGLALGFSVAAWRSQQKAHPAGITWAFITLHLSWGMGFLIGLLGPKTYFKEYVH